MWSVRLRPHPVRLLQKPSRAFASSFTRGRVSPRGPRNSTRRPERILRPGAAPRQPETSKPEIDQPASVNANYDPTHNTLLAPVHIPEDPNGVLKETHPATNLLVNSGLVVQRQLEMMNVMIGFEQANKYVIMDANGNHVGYMAEQERGMGNIMARQWFRTHRSFVTHVFDKHENEVLRFHRPFSWINSRIRVYDPLDISNNVQSPSTGLQNVSPGSLTQATDVSNARVSPLEFDEMRVIGEAQQQWAPLRRKYNLFTYHHSPNPATDMGSTQLPLSQSGLSQMQQLQLMRSAEGSEDMGQFNQFAYVDEPFLSWDFSLRSAENRLIGSVNRDFSGFAREMFTDTGVYALRMDSAALAPGQAPGPNDAATGMTLDQRAVMLATAVSVDFDYFSRHSNSGGFGFMPLWIPGMGGEATAGGAAGGTAAGTAAGEAGAVGDAAAGTLGRAGTAGGLGEGMAAGAAGAGAMAGYDAMSRGMTGDSQAQSPPPDQSAVPTDQQPPSTGPTGPYGDTWGEQVEKDPWGRGEEVEQDPWGRDQEDPWEAEDPSDGGEGGGDDFDWF